MNPIKKKTPTKIMQAIKNKEQVRLAPVISGCQQLRYRKRKVADTGINPQSRILTQRIPSPSKARSVIQYMIIKDKKLAFSPK